MVWHAHPSVVVGLLLISGAYLWAVGPGKKKFGWEGEISLTKVTTFLTGMLVLMVALLSPLHTLGDDYLFSAHMFQHLLLTLVVPPLLLIGMPDWVIRPCLKRVHMLPVLRFITTPIAAFVVFNTVFAIWHIPVLYESALREQGIHILEHIMFIGAGHILWWPILSPLPEAPRSTYLGQMIYLSIQPTVPSILGAMITFSKDITYSWYAEAPRIWNISAHTDQEIGGIIMWIPGGILFLGILITVFFSWANQEENYQKIRLASKVRRK